MRKLPESAASLRSRNVQYSAVNGHDPSPTDFFGSYWHLPQKFDIRLMYAAPETYGLVAVKPPSA
jgi:hypothetical protein